MRGSKKDLLYVALAEAVEGGGCPICAYLDRVQRGRVESILYELVNDAGVREKLTRSLGLCPSHAWLMVEIALENPLYGKLGPAIIYEHMLREYLDRFDGAEPFEEVNSRCFLCRDLRKSEAEAVESFAERLEDTDLMERYASSPNSLLCYKHYFQVLERLGDDARERLRAVQREKLDRLLRNLESFIEKHDYRKRSPFTKEESAALSLAVEALKGKPLVTNMGHIALLLGARGRGRGLLRVLVKPGREAAAAVPPDVLGDVEKFAEEAGFEGWEEALRELVTMGLDYYRLRKEAEQGLSGAERISLIYRVGEVEKRYLRCRVKLYELLQDLKGLIITMSGMLSEVEMYARMCREKGLPAPSLDTAKWREALKEYFDKYVRPGLEEYVEESVSDKDLLDEIEEYLRKYRDAVERAKKALRSL